MKRRILPLLLVLCLLWLTGCSFDDTSDEDLLQEIYGYYQSGKDKTDAPLTSFALPVLQGQTLDPITCPDGVQQTIGALLYEGLYALDTGFTPQPMLAESCTVSGTTCTITLRGGVTFSDGSAVKLTFSITLTLPNRNVTFRNSTLPCARLSPPAVSGFSGFRIEGR